MVKFKGNQIRKEGSKVSRNLFILGLMVAFTVVVNVGIYFWNNQDIEIVTLEHSTPQGVAITEKSFKKDTMTRKEYRKSAVIEIYKGFNRRAVVLWSDRHTIKTAYAAHYIRKDTRLYWDSLTTEPPQDYAYLYEMEGELLKLEVDANYFGNMLIPGDRLNIRITYLENAYNLPSDLEYSSLVQSGSIGSTVVNVSEKLFNEVTVLDILNADGESIFDMYYTLLNYDAQKQREFVKSESFKEKTTPKELLLSVTPEEADNYIEKMNKSPQLLMTLLPRTSKSTISEVLKSLGLE